MIEMVSYSVLIVCMVIVVVTVYGFNNFMDRF